MKILFALLLMCVGAHAGDKITLPILADQNGTPILTNAEFRMILGSRLTFKTAEGRLVGYDVDKLSASNLTFLKIDTGAAMAEQERINKAKRLYAERARVVAAYRAQKEQAFWAERKKKIQEQIEAQQKKAAEAQQAALPGQIQALQPELDNKVREQIFNAIAPLLEGTAQ